MKRIHLYFDCMQFPVKVHDTIIVRAIFKKHMHPFYKIASGKN